MDFKIAAMADSHNKHNKVTIPPVDMFIHAGDWSGMGRESETRNFAKWLNKLDARHIVVVPGNHEVEFEQGLPSSLNWILEECPRAHILIDQSVVIEGVKIHGSPITPWFHDWAWNRSIREDGMVYKAPRFGGGGSVFKQIPTIMPHWDLIPEDTDILVTHGPPYQILDELVFADGTPKGEHVGCHHLLERIKKVKPDIHIFGHIHCGHGQKHIEGTSFYNVALCDEMYMPSNGITIIDYKKEEV